MPSASDLGRRARAAAVLLAIVASGCTSAFEAPPIPSRPLPADATLRAGVARVDITPAPGLALFGHGPEGRVSRGILARLRCHAFTFTSGTEAVAIVPCDIAAPSLLLQRSIVRELRAHHPQVPLGVDRVVLAATHTHGGQAHYFGAGNYAGPLSTRRPQGTSQDVVDRLATLIAKGIADAWDARRPARLGWSHTAVYGLTKNRSMEAFARNAVPEDLAGDPAAQLVATALRAHHPAQQAVSPELSVLRVDAADGAKEPLGAIAFFGVHPTGVSNLNDLYHGDLFGLASRAVFEREDDALCGDRCPPVALVNGFSGDVSPIVDFQGPREARRWARDFAGFVREGWRDAEAALDDRAAIGLAYRELEMASAAALPLAEVIAPPPPRPGAARPLPDWVTTCACEGPRTCDQPAPRATAGQATCACLCDHASVGAAASGGAEDGRTAFSFIDGFREGSRVERDACHAPKNEVVGLGDCNDSFPHRVPLWSVLLGRSLLVTFPAEVTTVAGKRAVTRVQREIARRATDPRDTALHVVPATLTGDWLQYVATEEEYPSQQYEGASTLWGPASARFFERQAGCLAGWLVDRGTSRDAHDAICRLGQPAPFQTADIVFHAPAADLAPAPLKCASTGAAALCAAPGFIAEPADLPRCERVPTAAVRDGERGYQATFLPPQGCKSQRHVPRAAVVGPDGKVLDDDEGDGFELRVFSEGIGGHVGRGGLEVLPPGWLVSWFPDDRVRDRACAAGKVRLRVTLDRTSGAPIVVDSEPFDPCR